MSQKKKETTVKRAKTTTKKVTTTTSKKTTTTTTKRGRKPKEMIIQQSLPYYGSSQVIGHQYNKDKVSFAPPIQQESRTDNLVGDLVNTDSSIGFSRFSNLNDSLTNPFPCVYW